MSKYIIEIAKEYEEYFKGVLICGIADGKFAVDVIAREDLEELNSDYINEHYGELQDEAYQKGINDGSLDVKLRVEGAYQRGLDDAWEAARRIVVDTDHGGLALGTLSEIFGTQSYYYIMRENTAQEAIDKIKAYEHKDSDRIEVGDEVISDAGTKYTVTSITGKDSAVGFSGRGLWCFNAIDKLKKTGKHYDIASILEAMRE